MWPHTTWTPKHDCCMQFVDPLHTWTAATPSSLLLMAVQKILEPVWLQGIFLPFSHNSISEVVN